MDKGMSLKEAFLPPPKMATKATIKMKPMARVKIAKAARMFKKMKGK